jgi:hypothetical protein
MEYGSFVQSLFFDERYENFFIDKEGFLKSVGGLPTFASLLVKQVIESYQIAIDSASIVLAHSGLDAAAFDYFRVIEMIAPMGELETFIIKRQVSLENLKSKGYDQIVREEIHEFVAGLDRKSLLEKIDKMFQICQPPPKYSPIKGHTFDRGKTEGLDILRHKIVHGEGIKSPLTHCDEDIIYMRDTANFLMALVNSKYNVKINPTVWEESLQRSQK